MKQMKLSKNFFIHLKIDNLESKKRRDFFFDYVYLLYYKCHKINSKGGGLYTNYPDCIKKKVIINSKNRKR